jgi:RNA polymerase sigma factor (TIGR02999 family)
MQGQDPGIGRGPSLTVLLEAWRKGEGAVFGVLFDQAYAELRRIARQRIGSMGSDLTLSPTELVHEAVLRVMKNDQQWQDGNHFFASLSLYMRAVLVDRARARASLKRGGGATHLALSQVELGGDSGSLDLLALNSALGRLESLDPRAGAVLHLTCFAGLKRQQIAEVLGVSVQIVDRELRFAKSWLVNNLETEM